MLENSAQHCCEKEILSIKALGVLYANNSIYFPNWIFSDKLKGHRNKQNMGRNHENIRIH
jgi:hypothetical protein